jgi:hypothetical protein
MEELAIASDQVIVENTLLAALIVGCIYLERWLEEKPHRLKKTEIRKRLIIS